jgi:hypothetical protein
MIPCLYFLSVKITSVHQHTQHSLHTVLIVKWLIGITGYQKHENILDHIIGMIIQEKMVWTDRNSAISAQENKVAQPPWSGWNKSLGCHL